MYKMKIQYAYPDAVVLCSELKGVIHLSFIYGIL